MEAELIRVAVLGVVTAVFVMIISEKQPEIGLVLALAFGVIALVIAFGKRISIKAIMVSFSSIAK